MAIIWDDEQPKQVPTPGNIIWDDEVGGVKDTRKIGQGGMFTEAPPGPFEDTSLAGDVLAGVGSGMLRTGTGLAQGATELGAKITGSERLKGVSEKLRGYEEENRAIADMLKAKYGNAGIGNPISWAEFGGGAAPSAAFPIGRGLQAARTGMPGIIRMAAEGAGIGALGGAASPLTSDENRMIATGVGAVGGAALGPAVKGVAAGAGKLAQKGANTIGELEDKYALRMTNPEKYKEIYETTPLFEALDKPLRNVAPRTGAQIKSPEASRMVAKNDAQAIIDLTKLGNELPLVKERGRLPKTQEELMISVQQGKNKVMDWINEMEEAADLQGISVDIRPIIRDLRGVAKNPEYSKAQREHAKRLADEYDEDLSEFGEFTPKIATKRLSGLNNDLKSFFTGANKSGDNAEIVAITANKLRQQLNQTMDKLAEENNAFTDYRRMWGRLNGLEERVLRGYERRANKLSKEGVSMLDVIGYEQMLHGNLFQAAGTGVLKQFKEYIISPDPKVEHMFNLTRKNVDDELRPPTIPKGQERPKTAYDPSTGTRIPALLGTKGPSGTRSGGQPFTPETSLDYLDPTVGARVPKQSGNRTRIPLRPDTPEGLPPELEKYLDPTVGTRVPKQGSNTPRIPMRQEQSEKFPGLEQYLDPTVGARTSRVPKLQPGQLYKGWIYKGGNPANPENWVNQKSMDELL